MRSLAIVFLLLATIGEMISPVVGTPGTFSFVAAGDWGSGSSFSANLNSIATSGANFALAVGDFSYSTPANEQSWCNSFKSKISDVELIVGNHETWETNTTDGGGSINKYIQYCPFTLGTKVGSYGYQYYFDYPSPNPIARFIMVEPSIWNGTSSSSAVSYSNGTATQAWVGNQIDSARAAGITWIVVGMHKVCISTGGEGCEIGQSFMRFLIGKRVDLVLQGHDHNYQRSKQLTCATAGSYVSSCVANNGSSGSYTKGAGTIFLIDGTGGAGNVAINTSDSENRYFAAYSSTSIGYTKYVVTTSSIQAQFIPVSGSFTDSWSILNNAADFNISANPTSLSIQSGSSGTSNISLTSLNGFAGTVSLAATVSPSGLTASLSPSSVTLSSGGTGTSVLTASSSTTGTYTITVTGTSGTLSHFSSVTVIVGSQADFTISANPTTLSSKPGASATSTINLTSLNGFSGTISLSAPTSPSGLSASLSPTSVGLVAGGSAQSTLTISSQIGGTYTVNVTGTNGSLSHSTTVIASVLVLVASDGNDGPSSMGTGGGEKLIQDSAGKMIAVYVDSSGRIGLVAANSDPVSGSWSSPAKSSSPTSPYAKPAAVLLSLTSLRIIAEGGSGAGFITDISVIVQRDAQNNVIGFSFAMVNSLDTSGLARYPTAVLSHNGNVLAAWAWKTTTSSQIRSMRWDSGSGWTNLIGNSTIPDNVIVDNGSVGWMISSIIERPDNDNLYVLANRLSAPPQTLAYNKATWNGSSWAWGVQNLNYETNASSGIEDPGTLAWDPVQSVVVAAYGITGTNAFGVFTLNSLDQKTHLDTPSLPLTERDWGSIAVHITTGDYYIFLMNTNIDGGSGTVGYIRHPAGGSWTSTLTLVDSAIDDLGLSVRATGKGVTLDLLYLEGPSVPAKVKFARLSPVNPQDFSLSTNPSNIVLEAASSATSTINLSSLFDFAGTVSLSFSVSSPALAASLSPNSVLLTSGSSATSTLTLYSTTSGTYTVTVTGTSGSLSHSSWVTVNVSDFRITTPSTLTMFVNSTLPFTVALASLNGFADIVALTASVSPLGLTAAIAPSTVTLVSGGTGSSTLSATSGTVGTYIVTVAGSVGALSHSHNVSVRVVALPDFSIYPALPDVSFIVGSTGTSNVTIASLNGFTGTISLSTSTTPTGLETSCTPSSAILSSNSSAVSICNFNSSTTGSYVVIVSGTNGTVARSAGIDVHVADFSLAADPHSLTILTGSSGFSSVTLTSLNGFTGNVSLSLSYAPGLAGSLSQTDILLVNGGTGLSTLTISSSEVGSYSLTITALSGSLAHIVQVTVVVVDFSLSPDLSEVTFPVNSTGNVNVTIASLNGFAGNITLSTTVVPDLGLAMSCAPTDLTLNSGGFTISRCRFESSISGIYNATFSAVYETITHSATISVKVSSFSITSSPPSITVLAGSLATSSLTLTSLNGFSGNVSLGFSSTAGLEGSLRDASIVLVAGGAGVSSLTVSSPTVGDYALTITAVSGPLVRSLHMTVVVVDFDVIPNSPQVTFLAGSTGKMNVTVTSLNGFAGNLTVSTAIAPVTGLTVSCVPNYFALNPGESSTSVCTFNSSTAGVYNATVAVTVGAMTHSVIISVNVADFSITSSPTSLTFLASSQSISNITLSSLVNFSGTVSLSTSFGAGLNVSLSQTSIALVAGGKGTLLLTVASSTVGNYTVTVTGTTDSLTHVIELNVIVVDFQISASTTYQTIYAGQSAPSVITLNSLGGFTGSLTLTSSASVSGLTTTVSPAIVILTPDAFGTSTLIVSSTVAGTYIVVVTATSGSVQHSVEVRVNVIDFTVSSGGGSFVRVI